MIVRTAPFPVSRDKIKLAVIYVFTQERMMSFINSQESKPYVSSLIIDEAHEIQNGKRGIILQNAIEITLARFDSVKLLFASPLIKNPSYLLSLFNQTANGKYFVELVSPVSQNLILITEVNRKPKQLNISLLNQNHIVEIGDININFRFRDGIAIQRANLAVEISSNNESVLSFSNGPSSAESVAFEVSKLIIDFKPSIEILNFVDFIKREIHSEYPLINCVLKGVAFHYGNMPSLVRTGVENLFKEGHLKIICCTSTLLQGVNLPAKHIIIENPKSGDNPMTRANFLNLAGRAGRLLKEFHGNIWCVRPGGWESECYKGEQLQEISSAMSQVMNDGGTSIQNLLNNSELEHLKSDDAEAAFGKLYHDYLLDPSHEFIEQYRNETNTDILDCTLNLVKEVEVTLPIEILENNQSLRPDHLEALYNYLNATIELSEVIPLSPYVAGGKARMEDIFRIIMTCFEWNESEKYMSWVSWLAYQWLKGDSIYKILTGRVNNLKERNSDKSTSTIIRECLQVIENSIRFKLVKYFSAYIEVLRHVVLKRGLDHLLDEIEPYHIYLEFGSCNRHALNLMALGLSRFTALHLKDMFDFTDDVEAEEYLEQLKVMNVNSFKMPELCLIEVKDLIGLK